MRKREQHGQARTRLYKTWQNMKSRCEIPGAEGHHNYGGRGIKVHPEWSASFLAFARDVGPHPGKGMTLDRKDNNGHYEPGNTQWVTRKAQAHNMRKNHLLTLRGRTQTLTAWAEEIGLVPSVLHYRLKRMSVEKALTTPRRGGRPPGAKDEKTMTARKLRRQELRRARLKKKARAGILSK